MAYLIDRPLSNKVDIIFLSECWCTLHVERLKSALDPIDTGSMLLQNNTKEIFCHDILKKNGSINIIMDSLTIDNSNTCSVYANQNDDVVIQAETSGLIHYNNIYSIYVERGDRIIIRIFPTHKVKNKIALRDIIIFITGISFYFLSCLLK